MLSNLTNAQQQQVQEAIKFLGLENCMPRIEATIDETISRCEGVYWHGGRIVATAKSSEIVPVIFHELRHHWQYVYNVMQRVDGGRMWLGKYYRFHPWFTVGEDYYSLPWEKDANTFAVNFCKHLGIQPDEETAAMCLPEVSLEELKTA